jgi:hypothetical protein
MREVGDPFGVEEMEAAVEAREELLGHDPNVNATRSWLRETAPVLFHAPRGGREVEERVKNRRGAVTHHGGGGVWVDEVLISTLSLLLSAAAPQAPQAPEAPALEAPSPEARWRVGAGYYGDMITHPGSYLEFSWTAAQVRSFSFSLGADLGGYHHARNHSALFARGNVATRVSFRPGIFLEPRFVLGYGHTFVAGDGHFVIDDEGFLRERSPGGDPNFVYGVGLGLGYELQKGPVAGLGFLIRPEIVGRYPYNDFVLTQFSLLAGVQWRIGVRGRR